MGLASAGTSTHQSAPGLFLLAWGIFATVGGSALAANFRGIATALAENTNSRSWGRRGGGASMWQQTPRRADETVIASRVRLIRLVGTLFAIVGPIVTVAGVVASARGHIRMPSEPALPLPFAIAFIAISVLIVAQYWRRGGFLRTAARRGGWRLGAAIVGSLGALSFGVCIALGSTTLGIACWAVGGVAVIALLAGRKSVAGPGDDAPGGR